MKEITRRAMNSEMNGMACGPISIYAVDAEIVVEDSGNTVYLHTQWVGEASDMILFEATTESVYDAEIEISKVFDEGGEAFDNAIAIRDSIQADKDIRKIIGNVGLEERYAEQYEQLLQMMQEILDKDGIDFDLHTLEYRDECDDEEEE